MANEKIFAEEVLSDEQLEEVAGGNKLECYRDANFLSQLGVLKENDVKDLLEGGWFHKAEMQLQETWAKVGVVVIPHTDSGENEYYNSNGKQITRVDAFRIAAKQTKSKLNINQYL